MHKRLTALMCSSWLAFATTAAAERAAPTSAHDAATAEALFRQGRQALDAGHFQEACPRFAESHRLDPAAGTLMNLATCEEKLGKLASAWQHWKEAIDLLPQGDDRAPFARSRVSALEAKLPHLTIRVTGPLERSSKVLRDDTEIGPAGQGVPLPVDAGQHVVTVRTEGRFDGATTVNVGEGENKEVLVAMGAVDPVAAAQLAEQRSSASSGTRTLGWTLGGVGVAGLAGAIATGLIIKDRDDTVHQQCLTKDSCSAEGAAAASEGKTFLVLNTVSWVIAAAGIGTGAYFVLSSSRAQPSAMLAPTLTRSGAALSWVGRF